MVDIKWLLETAITAAMVFLALTIAAGAAVMLWALAVDAIKHWGKP